MILRDLGSAGLIYFETHTKCIYNEHVGRTMFHSHKNALAVAGHANRDAGKKVKRVIVAKQHFMVVDTRSTPMKVTIDVAHILATHRGSATQYCTGCNWTPTDPHGPEGAEQVIQTAHVIAVLNAEIKRLEDERDKWYNAAVRYKRRGERLREGIKKIGRNLSQAGESPYARRRIAELLRDG